MRTKIPVLPLSLLSLLVILHSKSSLSFFQHHSSKYNGNNGSGIQLLPVVAAETTTTALPSTSMVLTVIDSFAKNSPYTAAGLVCGFKAGCADLIAQTHERKNSKGKNQSSNTTALKGIFKKASAQAHMDWKRAFALIVYGSIYQGIAQEYIYNHVYPKWFGVGTDVKTVVLKVAFDLLIQTRFVTLPMAYFTKAALYRYSPKVAMEKYKHDCKHNGLIRKYYLLWGPVQCCTFSIIPQHYRVSFIAFVSFFWLIILSTILK